MTDTEYLYAFADEIGISVYNIGVSDQKKAVCLYVSEEDIKSIAIDKSRIETSAEEKMILAEEIGHFETGAFYLLETDTNSSRHRINRRKAEYKAKVWSIKKLLPAHVLQNAIGKCYSDEEYQANKETETAQRAKFTLLAKQIGLNVSKLTDEEIRVLVKALQDSDLYKKARRRK